MEEYSEFFDDSASELIERVESKLRSGESFYFDSDEYESIIDHYLISNDLNKCEIIIQLAMEQHPNSLIISLKRVQYLIRNNESELALALLNEVQANEPDNSDIHRIKGEIFSQLQLNKQAIDEFKNALEGTADNLDEIYSSIAYEYCNLGDYESAIVYFKKALEFDPENESFLYELTFCAEMIQKHELIVDFLLQYIDKNPYSKSAWFNLGSIYSSIPDYEKAIDAFDFVLAIDDTFVNAYINKGTAYSSLEKYEEALKAYKESLKYETPEEMTYYFIGECYEKLGQLENAEDFYRKAIESDPSVSAARIGLGCVLSEKGHHTEAIVCFKEAVKIAKNDGEAWYLLADEYMEIEEFAKAKDCYAKSVSCDTSNPDVWLDYSNSFAEEKNYSKAIEILQIGFKHHSDSTDFKYRMFDYYLNNLQDDEAFAILTEALMEDFDSMEQVFEYSPAFQTNPAIIEFIERFRPPELNSLLNSSLN